MKDNNKPVQNLESAERCTFRDVTLPVEKRVDALVLSMTLEEKIAQMVNAAAQIKRLNVPEYDWLNECLHGVAWAGIATVFPQAIGLAATFNTNLMHRVAVAISDEARAKHHEALRNGIRGRLTGLTFWSPNINIFRDPRWGRGQETYGEDPYLTARMGVEFVKGLQDDDARYLKLVSTPKHFAAHSGPEPIRHRFDAEVSQRDLRQTYLPAFEACIREAKAFSIMGAYSRLNGEPCCASKTLLQDILRDEWGFEGYVVSDCGAIADIYRRHHIVKTPEEASAMAVENGCDLNCGDTYPALRDAVKMGLISEEKIDIALKRLFTARFRLGMFDPDEMVSYAQIPIEKNDCAEHRALALQAARESIVLLKNENNFLPLDGKKIKRVFVMGPNADEANVMFGNYNGTPSKAVTALEGIRQRLGPQVQLDYFKLCGICNIIWEWENRLRFKELEEKADLVIAVMGISGAIEGEEGQSEYSEGGGDRIRLDLPTMQEEMLRGIHAMGKPIILVLMNGSPLSINWANENIPAIIEAWYPGEEGGTAIAEVIFGDYNPAGRLPITFPKSLDQLPPFTDYNMKGRTYRYMEAEPLYEFGFGLSYTQFEYSNLRISKQKIQPGEDIELSADVENVGQRSGDEVVQLYLSDVESSYPVPIRQLEGFKRITLNVGEKKTVSFKLTARQMALFDDNGTRLIEPGEFTVSIGGRQPDNRQSSSRKGDYLVGSFEVVGQLTEID